jgi:hypothetical protein
MTSRRIPVLFYGLFVDTDLLLRKRELIDQRSPRVG